MTTSSPTSASAWPTRFERMRQWPAWLLVSLCEGTTLIIGWFDHLAGRGASLFLFYALPIFAVTWLVNRKAGLWLAIGSGPIWWLANNLSERYPSPWTMLWMLLGRTSYFVFIAIGTAAIRNKHASDEAQIEMLKELRQLELEVVTTRENEQQRIGQDLHDGLCQQLAAISCAVQALAEDLKVRGVPEATDAEKIGEALQQNVVEARALAGGMASMQVDRQGLAAALATLSQTTNRLTGASIRLYASPTVKVDDPETATHLFRIAQEAVGNAVRHSGATDIDVRLEEKGTQLELRIDDNGCGMPTTPKHRTTGIGMQTMRFRAHAVGAEFIIHPRNGGGTSVRCTLPLTQSSPPDLDAQS